MKLELDKMAEIVEKAKNEDAGKIVFGVDVKVTGRNIRGLLYVTLFLGRNAVEFTTDVPDYKPNKGELESTLEELFSKFGISKFEVNIHNHEGGFHDKDVMFLLENSESLPKVIKYILKNFYESKNFDYCFN